jgi:hypothetical protein
MQIGKKKWNLMFDLSGRVWNRYVWMYEVFEYG